MSIELRETFFRPTHFLDKIFLAQNPFTKPKFTEEELKVTLTNWTHTKSPPWEAHSGIWRGYEYLDDLNNQIHRHSVILRGKSGSGKSTLLREEAWKLFKEGVPVVAWSAKNPLFSLTPIKSDTVFYEETNNKLLDFFKRPLSNLLYRPVLVIDNFDYLLRKDESAKTERFSLLKSLISFRGVRYLLSTHTNWPQSIFDPELLSESQKLCNTMHIFTIDKSSLNKPSNASSVQ